MKAPTRPVLRRENRTRSCAFCPVVLYRLYGIGGFTVSGSRSRAHWSLGLGIPSSYASSCYRKTAPRKPHGSRRAAGGGG